MNDHKGRWLLLAEKTGDQLNGPDKNDEDFVFPISRFAEVSKVIKFNERRRISDSQRQQLRMRMKGLRMKKSELQTKNLDKTMGSLNTEISGFTQADVIASSDPSFLKKN